MLMDQSSQDDTTSKTSSALFRVRSYQLPVMPPKLSGHPKSVPMVCRISL